MKDLIKPYLKFAIIGLLLTFASSSYGQSGLCDSITPFFIVDLTGVPDSAWVSDPPLARDGNCCGTAPPDKCVEFEVTLDPGTIAIQFDIASGAVPPGALYYQINCGPQVQVGEMICLSGVGPHTITFCKPGNNLNTYAITAIPEPAVSPDVTVTNDCSVIISSTGIQLTDIVWTSVTPGATGDWDQFLSCTNDCDSTTVTPYGSYPPSVGYQICGIPVAETCFPPEPWCDTITVYMVDSLIIDIQPNPAIFCQGDPISLVANINGGAPPYSINWYDPNGNVISQDLVASGTIEGTYTIEVFDQLYPNCPSYTESIFVTYQDPPIVNAGADFTICPSNPVVNLNGSVTNSTGGIWTGGGGVFSPDDTTLLATYTPTSSEVSAGSFYITLTSTGSSPCPSDTDSLLVTVTDTLVANVIAPPYACYNENVSVTVTATGGTGLYNYVWNTGDTTASVDIPAGTYNVNVTDNTPNSCTASAIVLINSNPEITVSVPADPVVACDSVATITGSASGGTGGFSYLWNTGDTVTTISANTGIYILTATDNAGCSASDTVSIISSNSVLGVTISQPDTVCFGASASFSAQASGGFPPYTYSWDNGVVGPDNFGSVGSYCVTVEDSAGCINLACITVYEYDSLVVSIIQPDLICNGETTTITAQVNGGGPPYNYVWSNGSFSPSTVVPAGAYTVDVFDSSNPECTGSASVLVPEAPPLLLSFIPDDVSCYGGADGTLTAQPTGGVGSYSYQWSTGVYDSITTGLSANTIYSIIVTDSLGCQVTGTATVNEPNPLNVSISPTMISCFGGNDGTINASVNGGTQPYNYDWFQSGGNSLGQYGQQATGLQIGTYYVLITDTNNCTVVSSSVNLSQPTAIQISTTPTDPSCFNSCDGSVAANASGGNGGYSYLWDDNLAQTDSVAINLCEGIYTVLVTDQLGCSAIAYNEIYDPTPLVLDTSTTSANCGLNDGSGCVIATGGTAPYSYLWSGGGTNSCNSNLAAGSYLVEVTDGNGCQAYISVDVQDNQGPSATITSYNDLNCFESCDGSATVGFQGGSSGPMFVQWDAGTGNQITPTATNLCAGIYGVTITDTNGCTAATSVQISQPNELIASLTLTNPNCNGDCNGIAIAQVTGGTPGYTYQWFNSSGVLLGIDYFIESLCDGTYSLLVTDANGCTDLVNFTMTEPPLITATTSVVDVNCFDYCNGQISVIPQSGAAPFSFQWDSNAASQTTATATNLCAGTYGCTVTDNNGCAIIVSATVDQPLDLMLNFTNVINVNCNGECNGSVEVVPSGGTPPYSVSWSNGSTSSLLSNLCAGTYCVTITDVNGCQESDCITITEPDVLELLLSSQNVSCNSACDGMANVQVLGGTSPYNVFWNSPGFPTTPSVSNLCAGSYTCQIQDANGCLADSLVVITQPSPMTLTVDAQNNASCGQSNGSICVNVSGGVGNIDYQWYDAAMQQSSCVTNIPSGCYTFIGTDQNNCEIDTTICIDNVSGPTITVNNQVDATCPGINDGSITVSASSSATPISTYWLNGMGDTLYSFNNQYIATNLGADCYTFIAIDNAGCIANQSICIDQPLSVSGYITQIIEPSCNNSCDASATVTASGGTSPYTYLWSSGTTPNTSSTNGLCAGVVSVTIQDVNGCQTTVDSIITQPDILALQNSTTNQIYCSGDCTGYINIDVMGGSGPYSYNWSPAVSSSSYATNLCASVYTISVVDINGCDTSFTFDIVAPNPLNITTTTSNATCSQCNASATANANGGSGPYSFLWETGAVTPTVNGSLCPGTVGLTVTDDNGCSTQVDVVINNEPGPAIDSMITSSPLCNGSNNGDVSVYASGGTTNGSYSYLWGANANNQTTQTATALISGTYCVSVFDLNNCQASACATIDQPTSITAIAELDTTICYGQETSIWGTGQGGTQPYSLTWNTNPVLNGGGPHIVTPTSGTTYCMTVTDAHGCQSQPDCVEILVSPPLLITTNDVSIICPEDTVTLTAYFEGGNGSNYMVDWFGGALSGTPVSSVLNGLNSSASVNPSDSIWYYVTVNDGCSEMAYDSILVPVHYSPNASASLYNIIGCAPLTTTAFVTPDEFIVYNYDFNCDDVLDISSNEPIASYIYTQPGDYNVCITLIDSIGCISEITAPQTVTVWPVPQANFTATPPITDIYNSTILFTDQSSGNLVNTWMFENDTITGTLESPIFIQNTDTTWGTYSEFSHIFPDAGDYPVTLIVSNEFACQDSITRIISIKDVFNIFVPNAITPNGDGNNEIFYVKGTGIDPDNFELLIFNRWGELIFQTNDYFEGWDATFNDVPVVMDVYVWKITAIDLNGDPYERIGHVSVLR